MKPGSPTDLRRRFRSGRPCLDLVHTGGEDALTRFEIVHTAEDLGRLLGVILSSPALPARGRDLAEMRRLRSAVTRIAYGLAEGVTPVPVEPPRPDDPAVINSVAAAPPLVPALQPDGSRTVVAPTAAAALSDLARDAIDLFAGPLAARLRVCAADNCGLLLLDTSRSGGRRWCSMQLCGNRAKARTFRAHEQGARP